MWLAVNSKIFSVFTCLNIEEPKKKEKEQERSDASFIVITFLRSIRSFTSTERIECLQYTETRVGNRLVVH